MSIVAVVKKGTSKKNIDNKLKKLQKKKGFPASKYSGSIKIDRDALQIQKELRDEWKESIR